jgi:uncharacterized OB-fold protein
MLPATTSTCPRCGGTAAPAEVDGDGVVWSYTVQRFAPKSPPYVAPATGYQPFVVVYVETADGTRVEGILDVPDLSAVSIGQPVCLAAVSDVPRYRLAEVQPDERKRDE